MCVNRRMPSRSLPRKLRTLPQRPKCLLMTSYRRSKPYSFNTLVILLSPPRTLRMPIAPRRPFASLVIIPLVLLLKIVRPILNWSPKMSRKRPERQQFLEIILIVICVALCALLYRVGNYRMVVLNLFYLPIVLAAFFLGRYRAGILALLSVICASVVIALNLNTFAASTSPLAIGLALTIWGAVMGINAILAGTLSDESTQKIDELHDAYLGVVEVLVRYLNSADPTLKYHARRLSEISQQVAVQMRLSDTEIDNIRVAALLQDIDSIEVTARVIRKAVGDLTHDNRKKQLENTFHGRDLVQALGSVLTGALPLLVCHGESLNKVETDDGISY